MSSRLAAVYSVPLDELRALPGSFKKEPAQMIARDFIGREEIDEMFAECDLPNTLESAVQQILNGEPLREDCGTLYGYAVEGLCWAIGSTFFLPTGFPTIEYFDGLLQRHSAPVSLNVLTFSGFPLPIPKPSDYPFAGCWLPEQVIAASEFFDRLRVDRETPTLQLGVETVRRWLAEAMKHETDALVGFYY